MRLIRATLAVLGLLASTACHPTQSPASSQNGTDEASLASSGLSPQEETAIKQGVVNFLTAKRYRPGISPAIHSCTEYFTVGEPKIVDTSITGDTGKLRVSVPITALAPEDLGPGFEPPGRYQYPVEYCYGYPQGGWSQGQTSNSVYVVSIEHWQSGWRMSATEKLVQD